MVLITPHGEVLMEENITHTLRARGVSILGVTPRDYVIEVRARVPLVGTLQVRLLKVKTCRT